MRKSVLTMLLTGTMMVSGILGGCGGSKAAPAPKGADGGAVTTTAASSGKGENITFWNIATDEPDKTLFTWAVDKYNNENSAESGYHIEQVSTVNDQYKEKLIVAMGAGECPDVYSNWTGGSLVEYVKSGYAKDLTELVDKYGLRDLYTEASLAQATIDGKIYAIPTKANTAALFFYDKKMWADKG